MALSLNNAQDLLLSKFSYLDFATNAKDFDDNYKCEAKGSSLLLAHVGKGNPHKSGTPMLFISCAELRV